MKKVVILFFLLVIAIIGSLFIKKSIDSKYNYTIESISEFKYYIYKENNQYGVIDENGKIIIDAKYKNVIIPNPSKDIFICYLDEKSNVLNSNNEKLYEQYDLVEPIKLKNVANTLSYEKSTLSYKKNGKFGLINLDGKELTKNIYDSIENLQPTEGKFLVSKDKKYGVIDLNGNKIIKTEYDLCDSDEYYTKENGYTKSGYIVANKTEDGYRFGYYNYMGKKVLDIKYNDIERVLKEDIKNIYLIASENGKYGLYNKGKNIIKNDYQEIVYDDNLELLMLQKNKKYGVANLSGKILIDANCDEINSRGIYLYVTKSGNNTVYNSNGDVVDINFNASIYNTLNEDYKISTLLNNNITYYGITDKNGNRLVEDKYRYIEYLYKNFFIAQNEDGKLGIINSNGKESVEIKYSSIQKIKDKNIVYAIDSNGISEFYSEKIEKVLSMENANVSIQNDYIIITNENDKKYLDNSGNIVEDVANLKKEDYPNRIGEYEKEQTTIENICYVKK